jgi:hypothetical protein
VVYHPKGMVIGRIPVSKQVNCHIYGIEQRVRVVCHSEHKPN